MSLLPLSLVELLASCHGLARMGDSLVGDPLDQVRPPTTTTMAVTTMAVITTMAAAKTPTDATDGNTSPGTQRPRPCLPPTHTHTTASTQHPHPEPPPPLTPPPAEAIHGHALGPD